MIAVVLKNKEYQLPSTWEELNPKQFIFLLKLLNTYTHGKIPATTVGVNFAMYLLGIKKPRFLSAKQKQLYLDNLAWLGDKVAFWWRVKYANPDVLINIDPELKKQLKTNMPEDLPQTPEVRVLCRERKWFEPNFTFSANLIPKINKYQGYAFSTKNKLMSTSLTAGQFSESLTVCNEYGAQKQAPLLNILCSILYNIPADHKHLSKIPEATKQAVYVNFTAVMGYITKHTKFALLFTPGTDKQAKISIGFNKNIYTLAKNGYGDTNKLSEINLITFLDLLLNELIDSVKTMQSMDMDLGQIANRTGLSIQQIKLIAP